MDKDGCPCHHRCCYKSFFFVYDDDVYSLTCLPDAVVTSTTTPSPSPSYCSCSCSDSSCSCSDSSSDSDCDAAAVDYDGPLLLSPRLMLTIQRKSSDP